MQGYGRPTEKGSTMEEPITLKFQCVFCGEGTEVTVPHQGYLRWRDGALIQDALPELSTVQREQLIVKICSACVATY